MRTAPSIFLLAEFPGPEAVLGAAKRVYAAGYRKVEAYTPFPVEGLAEAIGFPRSAVAPLTLFAGIIGGLTGFFMCYYANVISYPWNIGGRPHNSWPAWIPITFELTVLFSALTAAIGMITLNGLPRLHHPLFESSNFLRASRDRFFLAIESTDPAFNPEVTRALLASCDPLTITEVPA